MQVIATKDSQIKEHNMSKENENQTGEVSVTELSSHPTRELETGKVMPVNKTIAQKPEQAKVVSESSGEILPPSPKVETAPGGTKIVSVLVSRHIKCKIGKKWYEFHPKSTYRVPENVKEQLRRANALGVI